MSTSTETPRESARAAEDGRGPLVPHVAEADALEIGDIRRERVQLAERADADRAEFRSRAAGHTERTPHRPQQPAAPTTREDAYATPRTPAELSSRASPPRINPQPWKRGEMRDSAV